MRTERNMQNLILGVAALGLLAMATMSSVSRKDVEVREPQPKMKAYQVAGALLCDDREGKLQCLRLPEGAVLLIPIREPADSTRAK